MKKLIALIVIAASVAGAWYMSQACKQKATPSHQVTLGPIPTGKEAQLEQAYVNVRRFIEVGTDCKESINALVSHLKNATQNKNERKGASHHE